MRLPNPSNRILKNHVEMALKPYSLLFSKREFQMSLTIMLLTDFLTPLPVVPSR